MIFLSSSDPVHKGAVSDTDKQTVQKLACNDIEQCYNYGHPFYNKKRPLRVVGGEEQKIYVQNFCLCACLNF